MKPRLWASVLLGASLLSGTLIPGLGSVRIDDLSELPNDSATPSASMYAWVTDHSWLSSISVVTAIVTALYVFDAGFKQEVRRVGNAVRKSVCSTACTIMKKGAALQGMLAQQWRRA